MRPIAPGFFHDVILPISMYTPDEDQLVCRHRFIDDVKTVEFFQNSVKAYVVEWALARPILLIGSANPTPTSTDDGDVADLAPSNTIGNNTSDFQPPTNTNNPKEVTNQRSGLPAGVIVGIADCGYSDICCLSFWQKKEESSRKLRDAFLCCGHKSRDANSGKKHVSCRHPTVWCGRIWRHSRKKYLILEYEFIAVGLHCLARAFMQLHLKITKV